MSMYRNHPIYIILSDPIFSCFCFQDRTAARLFPPGWARQREARETRCNYVTTLKHVNATIHEIFKISTSQTRYIQYNITHNMTNSQTPSEKSYNAYLIPAKVNKSFATTEFESNFNTDEKVHFNEQELTANYLTGKKILGTAITSPDSNLRAVIVKSTEDDAITDLKPVKKIANLQVTEREGNEHALIDEVKKFNEYINLMNTIHS